MSSVIRENVALLAGAGVATASLWWYWTRPSVPMPPGPTGNLIFGSALELAKSNAYWLDIAKYADQYGPIFSLRMLFQRVVVINDPTIAINLLEGRATQYSDRHVSELAKLAGWDRDISFTPYGPRLRLYRGLLYRALNSRAALDYIPLQEQEIRRMLKKLSEKPEDFIQDIYLMSATVSLRFVYGYKVESPDDRFLKNAEQFIEVVSELLSPGKWMIEVFPILRYVPTWFPGAIFHKKLASWRPIIHANQVETFEYVKRQMAEIGKAEPSFVSKLLHPEDDKEVTEEDEFYIKSIAGTLYGAATDTTVSLIKSFFLAMLIYPDVQAQAQAEIAAYLENPEVKSAQSDRVLPITMADREHLPYTNAIILETLRWHPVAALLVHRSYDQDDNNVIANGKTYRIPACTNVLVNAWSILHDPQEYPEPEKFKPERYLVDNPPRNPDVFAFGLGRRICPGIVVAQQLLWLSISNVLANFSIIRTKDENGVEIIPEEIYTSGMVCHPAPFKCDIQTLKGREKWISEIEN